MKVFILMLATMFAFSAVAVAEEIPATTAETPAAIEVMPEDDGQVVQQSAKKKKKKKSKSKKKTTKKKKKKKSYDNY